MENSNEKKETRGGLRAGAGRKPMPPELKRVNVTVSLSREGREALAIYASAHGISQSQAIETVFLSLVSTGEEAHGTTL